MINPGDIISVDHTRCTHTEAEPVTTLGGSTVAYLCPGCDAELPAGYGQRLDQLRAIKARQDTCQHDDTTEMTAGGTVVRCWCDDCGKPLPLA